MNPDLSVVVSTYDDQAGLDRVLAALAHQDLAPERFEVVVADDGSPREPVLGSRPFEVALVRRPDEGFRLAATRNLGAAQARGRLLCFLDGDTVPEPGYLSATLAAADEIGGRCLLVGRRRHADLTGWSADDVASWLRHPERTGPDRPRELTEPGWLVDAYAASDDLLHADEESYRYVIGAVLSLSRYLWDAVGGFDESFSAYGGEDWELAHRCWLAGATLRHVRAAVAWHDGPDLAGREGLRQVLERQAFTLATRLPSPALRPAGVLFERPVCVVEVDDRGWPAASTLLVVASFLRGGPDARVWLTDGARLVDDGPLADDVRVRRGPVPEELVARASWRVRVDRPVELQVRLATVLAHGPGRLPGVRVDRTRDLALGIGTEHELPRTWVAPVEPGELGAVLRRRHEAADGAWTG